MRVRVATLDDAEAAARVHWLSSNTAYGRDDPFERRLETTREVLGMDGFHYFVAAAGDDVVGIACVLGNELLERAHEQLALAAGEAELTVLAGNTRARRFYERNGWVPGELVTEPHFGGIPTDVARYSKHLA